MGVSVGYKRVLLVDTSLPLCAVGLCVTTAVSQQPVRDAPTCLPNGHRTVLSSDQQ